MGAPPAEVKGSELGPARRTGGLEGKVLAALLVQVTLSAGTFLVVKSALRVLPPVTFILWRVLVAGLAFGVLLAATRGPKFPPRRVWKQVLVLGLLAGPLNQLLFFTGLSHSVPAHAALFYALTPLGVYALSVARKRERLTRGGLFGILTALAGTVLLLSVRNRGAPTDLLWGDGLILGAVVAWVFYTADSKPLATEFGALRASAWSLLAGMLLMLPFAPVYLAPQRMLHASAATWSAILYVGLLTSVASYWLWSYALSRTDASKVAVFSNLQPVATALAAWALLGDPLSWALAAGGLLVLVGVRVTQRAR